MQLDPTGGTLFALTVLTEIAVLAIQLLLLNVEDKRLKQNTIHKLTLRHTNTFNVILCVLHLFQIERKENYL